MWHSTLQGRLSMYCDAVCRVHERRMVLSYYEELARLFPEWATKLRQAVALSDECAAYGGFLWQHLTMDDAGYEKFDNPQVRAVLASEGRRCRDLDAEAVGHVEALLARE